MAVAPKRRRMSSTAWLASSHEPTVASSKLSCCPPPSTRPDALTPSRRTPRVDVELLEQPAGRPPAIAGPLDHRLVRGDRAGDAWGSRRSAP